MSVSFNWSVNKDEVSPVSSLWINWTIDYAAILWATFSSTSSFKSLSFTALGSIDESINPAWETPSRATTGNLPVWLV